MQVPVWAYTASTKFDRKFLLDLEIYPSGLKESKLFFLWLFIY
ncbi:MAG: hypothetical protein Ct9H300mP24_9010 [Candidatus Neomarinimicrobiota bacterium]|nr:MAG: hypothetical protein Ct9H300mP24_9010 [Candidatus Neomarinimicrobiota bacterium]